jgi:signal peptidase I
VPVRGADLGTLVRRRPGLSHGPGAGTGPVGGPGPGSPSRFGRRVRRLALGLLAVLVLGTAASVAGLLPLQLERVDADSMAPTLGSGDLLVVDRWGDASARSDVVAVDVAGELLVKRVVAVGGDRVSIEDGVLVVDGIARCGPVPDGAPMDGVHFGPVDVPPGELFLLGDNAGASVDSRAFGTVPATDVLGVVAGRVWPSPGALPLHC